MINLQNGFYEEPGTGFVTLVVDNKLYDITGDGECMLPGCIPGIIGENDDDEFAEFLRDECDFSTSIELDDCMVPWISEECAMTFDINDIDIEHAISCEELWDKSCDYFND